MRKSQQKSSVFLVCWNVEEASMANSVDPDQTAPIGAVCFEFTLFASILNLSVMLGNYLQQKTLADDIFRCIFFFEALGANGHIIAMRERSLLVNPKNVKQLSLNKSPDPIYTEQNVHVYHHDKARPRGNKTWVLSQTRNKGQWLVACGHVSLGINSSFITSRQD